MRVVSPTLSALRAPLPPALCALLIALCLVLSATGLLVAPARAAEDAPAGRQEAAFQFATAREAAAVGKTGEALAAFERALELDPEAPYLRVEYADLLFRLRRLPEAAEQIEAARALGGPNDFDVLSLYGQIHFAWASSEPAAGEKALEAFERLRRERPEDISAMLSLAQLQSGMGRPDAAIEVVRELVSYHPANRQLSRLLVQALQEAGRNEEAEAVLADILRLDDEALESRLELARLQSERGNHSAAIDALSSAGPEIRNDARLRSQLAEEHFRRALAPGIVNQQRQSDLVDSERILDALLTDHPDSLHARFLRARVRGQTGRFAEAVDDLEVVHEGAPLDPTTVGLLARYLEEAGRQDEAAELLQGVAQDIAMTREGAAAPRAGADDLREQLLGLEARRGGWESVARLSRELLENREPGVERLALLELHLDALVRLGEGRKALDAIAREEKRSQSNVTLLLLRAQVQKDMDRPSKAVRTLEDPLFDQPLERPVLLRRADLLWDLGQEDLARSSLLEQAKIGSLDETFAAGQFLSLKEEYSAATPLLIQAAEGTPEDETFAHTERWFWLGQAHERLGRHDEAARAFEKVLALEPQHAPALNYLGYMWADLGINLERAVELIRQAVAQQPDNGAYVDSLGWAQFRLGELETARDTLERAVELVGSDATVLEHLGDVYVALGELDRAREMYQQALEINDDENVETVREKLSRIDRDPPQ